MPLNSNEKISETPGRRPYRRSNFSTAQKLANEQYARDVSAEYSKGYSFDGMDLSGTNLRGLRLTACAGSQPAEGTSCSSFLQADMSGSLLALVDLTGANLVDANLSNALMGSATLSHAIASGVNMHCAGASGSNFVEGVFTSGDFTETNLEFATFANADLSNADFTGADISNASFDGALIENARFEEAWYLEGEPPQGLPQTIIDKLATRETRGNSC